VTVESNRKSRSGRRAALTIGLVAAFIVAMVGGMWIGSGGLSAFLEGTPPVKYVVIIGQPTPTATPTASPGGASLDPSASPTPSPSPGATPGPTVTRAPTARPTPTPTPAGTPVHWYTASPSPTPTGTPYLPNLRAGYINLPLHPKCGTGNNVNFMITNNGPVAAPAGTKVHFHAVDVYAGEEHVYNSTPAQEPAAPLPGNGIGVNILISPPLGAYCGALHGLYVQVDPHHAIAEGYRGDNQQARTFTPEAP
jgi:hypothetical protein